MRLLVEGLFSGGQFNGSSGYEEAAGRIGNIRLIIQTEDRRNG